MKKEPKCQFIRLPNWCTIAMLCGFFKMPIRVESSKNALFWEDPICTPTELYMKKQLRLLATYRVRASMKRI